MPMSLHPAQLLKRLEPPVRPAGAGALHPAAQEPFETRSFEQLLTLVARGEVRSERAVQSVDGAKIAEPLSGAQLERLASAADVAEAAGARRALMLIDGRGVVVDIANRTVIDELTHENATRTVSVDAAVHVISAKPVERPLPPPGSGLPPAQMTHARGRRMT